MNKYITLENKIYEAKPVLVLQKVNDEILPANRKSGSGADKNQFFIQSEFYDNLNIFFPEVIMDREEKKTGRNKPIVKNYFDISSIANDISIINKEIDRHYPNEEKLTPNELVEQMKDLSQSQSLQSTFYIESEIANAQNGIAFKNWNSEFKQIIKELLLPTTQIKVFLFNMDGEVCAFWQFNQEYITHNRDNIVSSKLEKIIQKIYYGAPGTGKSHKVNELIKENEGRTERITFHPEYDYSSFVGGYKPAMDGDNIKYQFVPQAFTNIYVNAWNDLENDYYLVIEEINRGNCAEIFGDIFQLLDRSNDYKITPSKELKEYLKTKLSSNENIDESKLLLPPNLNILATMNTSDQSLYPMDSAFKRRWDWEYIPIDYSRNTQENTSAKFVVELSEEESFNWLYFIENVNKLIKENENLGMDKCLGNYFIKPDKPNNTISNESFINKAIFYLWNDVFKDEMEDDSIFKDKTSYEDFFPIHSNGLNKVKEILEILKVDLKAS
jgi:AAA domain (dynein-related subfamily)